MSVEANFEQWEYEIRKEEREQIIAKILNDKEQRWLSNDYEIDEGMLRKLLDNSPEPAYIYKGWD